MILIDTHLLIWLMEGGGGFGDKARGTLRDATVAKAVYISAITSWEIAMLSDKGRLRLSMAVQAWVERALALPGMNLAPIESAIAVDAGTLPGEIHGDPADRFLIATARTLACPIMTVDRAILDYARQGHVKAVDARR